MQEMAWKLPWFKKFGPQILKQDIKEARSSFFGLRVEVLKLQSRIEDKL